MRNRLINYLILSVALCLGQMVTQAHIIGHLELATPHHDHADHHAGAHNHSSQSVDFRSKPTTDTSFDSLLAECGIYHVFVGMYGLATSYRTDLIERSVCEIQVKAPAQQLVTQANEWHLIRGPPTNS